MAERATIRLLSAVLGVLAILTLFGCDPSFATVAINTSGQDVLVGRIGVGEDGLVIRDVVQVPDGSTRRLRSPHADSWPSRIVVMSRSCDVLGNEVLPAAFDDGGVVAITALDDVQFQPGGNTGGDSLATPTGDCGDTIGSLTPR